MVMDKGMISEFDSPETLLQDKEGVFYSMAKDAGIIWITDTNKQETLHVVPSWTLQYSKSHNCRLSIEEECHLFLDNPNDSVS